MPEMSQEEYEAQAHQNWLRRQAAAEAEQAANNAAMQRITGEMRVIPQAAPTPAPAPAPTPAPLALGAAVMEYRTDPVTGKKQFRTSSNAPWQDDTAEGLSPIEAKRPSPTISGTGSSVTVPPAAGTGTGASTTPPPAQATPAPKPFDFNTLDDAGKMELFQKMAPWLQQQKLATPRTALPPQGPEPITDPTTGSIITPDHPGYNQLRKTLGMPDISAQPAVSPAAYRYSRFPSLGGGMPSPRGWEQGQGQGFGRGRGRGWGRGGRWGGPGEVQAAPPGPGETPFQSPNKTPSGLYNDPRLKPAAPPRNSFASQNPYTGFAKPPGAPPTPKPQNQLQPPKPADTKTETL